MSNVVIERPALARFIAGVSLSLESSQIQARELERFAVDGIMPDVAVTPGSIGELQAVLTEAHKAGISVMAVGGGKQLGIGNVPTAYDAAISLERMGRVIDYEPADLTVTLEPGLRLLELQELLAMSGQYLPLDPPVEAAATIGGVLATNASGPMRHAYGTARDWLIGTRVVHADGTSSKSGGRVVKNVTGYDMHKLHIGALGTLGIIVEATFKLAPLAPTQTTIAIAHHDSHAACAMAIQAHDAGLAIQSMEVLSPTAANQVTDDARWTVLVRCAGGRRTLERTLAELEGMAAEAGSKAKPAADDVWSRWSSSFVPGAVSLRVAVMPSMVAATIDALDRSLTGAATRISATVTAGLLRVQLQPAREEQSTGLIERAGEIALRNAGTMMIDSAPASAKQAMDVFGAPRSDFPIMKRLKEQFDPDSVLAPGRFAGRL